MLRITSQKKGLSAVILTPAPLLNHHSTSSTNKVPSANVVDCGHSG